ASSSQFGQWVANETEFFGSTLETDRDACNSVRERVYPDCENPDEYRGDDNAPRVRDHRDTILVNHRAPARRWWLLAQPKKGQPRNDDDRIGEADSGLDHKWTYQIGEDLLS